MARSLRVALAALSFAVPALLPSPVVIAQETAAAPLVNKVILRINDRIATLYDYELRRSETERELLRGELSLAERRQLAAMLPERVFADIYQEMLLLSRADQLGVVFSEEEIDQQLSNLQERHGFADRAEFEAALTQGGLSMRDFREQLHKNMRIQDVVAREVRSRIGMDDELARRFYNDNPDRFTEPRRVRVREVIVLEVEGQSAEDRATLAAAIQDELEGGRELAEVVATYRDRGLTSDVIDHGWVAFGDLAGELEAAIWDLPPGSFSDPVASRGGLHILEVVERQEAGLRPFAEVADRVAQEATQRAFLEQMATYLDELEKAAYIQLDPPPGAEGFRQAAASELVEGLAEEPPADGGEEAPEAEAAEGSEAPQPPPAAPPPGG